MNIRGLSILISISFLILSACAPGQLQELGRAGADIKIGQSGESAQGQPESEPGVTGEVAPRLAGVSGDVNPPPAQEGGSGGNVSSPSDQGGESGGNISSRGDQSAGVQDGSQAGEFPSYSSSAHSAAAADSQPVKWLTYTDEAHRFSIQYPDSYVILPGVELRSGNVSPGPVAQVRFQDQQLAAGDTADLEPPKFTVEVFAFTGNAPLERFIKSNVKFPGASIGPYTIGVLSGLRVSTGLMLSPNEFYFFAGPDYIYKLTPQGEYGDQMLQSFRILQP